MRKRIGINFFYLFIMITIISTVSAVRAEVSGYQLTHEQLLLLDRVQVQRVIDGDTIVIEGGSKVRFIGLDCPEIAYQGGRDEYFAREALEYTSRLLEGNEVFLEYDISQGDDYGRVLAYLYLGDGTFFNLELLREGYARLFTVPPDVRHIELFKKATREAREAGRGLWNWWEDFIQGDKGSEIPLIPWQEAKEYIGQEVVVEGKIIDTFDTGEICFLNFNPEFRDTLSIVIFKYSLNRFDYNPQEYLLDKVVMIKGRLLEYKGAPEIIVDDPLQVYRY